MSLPSLEIVRSLIINYDFHIDPKCFISLEPAVSLVVSFIHFTDSRDSSADKRG